MADPCAKCDWPITCKLCARRALRRVAALEGLIVNWAKDLEVWKRGGAVDCDGEIRANAARITKKSEKARRK